VVPDEPEKEADNNGEDNSNDVNYGRCGRGRGRMCGCWAAQAGAGGCWTA
jgi:hypothetical protein